MRPSYISVIIMVMITILKLASQQVAFGCGTVPFYDKRIIGGTATRFAEWPWLVAIIQYSENDVTENSQLNCGGTLLNHEWVLTAAHCVSGIPLVGYELHIGGHNITEKNTEGFPTQIRSAKKKIEHPQFFVHTGYMDLALLQLNTPVEYARHIQPICVSPKHLDIEGKTATVVGYGFTDQAGFDRPEIPHKTDIKIERMETCIGGISNIGRSRAGLFDKFCGGNRFQGTWLGDSGGPLQHKVHDKWYLVGVVHGTAAPLDFNMPGAFQNISTELTWISKTTGIALEKFDSSNQLDDVGDRELRS